MIAKLGHVPFIISVLLLWGCGQSTEEKRFEAMETAKVYLTYGQCQPAIDVMEAVGRDDKNADYLQLLASAYACRAEYNEIAFVTTDIAKLNANNTLIGTLATFTTSQMTSPIDQRYLDLQMAIDILLYAGGISNPSSAERLRHFSTGENGDINMQLLFMVIAQLGKFSYYYGNMDPTTGVKGAATNGNGNVNLCFYDYPDPDVDGFYEPGVLTAGSSGTCDEVSDAGHPSLSAAVGDTVRVDRLCQGVILMNNFVDTLLGTVLSNDEVDDIETVQTFVNGTFAALCTALGLGSVCTVKSYDLCVTENSADKTNLEKYFGAVFENLTN